MPTFTVHRIAAAIITTLAASATPAADWSDTSLGYRYGTKFREPYNPNDIAKNIFSLTHASGYKYGSNFFNVDMLLSDGKDPAAVGPAPTFLPQGTAQEVYVLYRTTVDLEKTTGSSFKVDGWTRGLGITGGFDLNTKADAGYNSKKRMLVLGPTVSMDVPGFLNVSLLALWESNAPCSDYKLAAGVYPNCVPRYQYDTHGMIGMSWGIPVVKDSGFSFQGFANFIAAKGRLENGQESAPETNVDMALMYDFGRLWGSTGTAKAGFAYQYWRNKFGNNYQGPAGSGAFAHTPMIRAEYHF